MEIKKEHRRLTESGMVPKGLGSDSMGSLPPLSLTFLRKLVMPKKLDSTVVLHMQTHCSLSDVQIFRFLWRKGDRDDRKIQEYISRGIFPCVH